MKIAFIGCSKKKRIHKCQAYLMYQGELFISSLLYCRRHQFDSIYILSAKYGILELESIIEPYDISLNNMTEKQRKKWSEKIKIQINEKNIEGEFWFFCGNKYHKYFDGIKPLSKLGIGQQLKWLKTRNG